MPALFDEVAIYFSDEEWDVLTEPQRALYREVMRMNYDTVLSLEFPFPKPDVISRLEGEGEAQDCDAWQFPGGTFAGGAMKWGWRPSRGAVPRWAGFQAQSWGARPRGRQGREAER